MNNETYVNDFGFSHPPFSSHLIVFTVTETCSKLTGARQNCPASVEKSKVNLAGMDIIFP